MKTTTGIVAAVALAISAGAASAAFSIHVSGGTWGVWVTIGNPTFSNVNPQGTAGEMTFTEPTLDPNMGFLFPLNNGLVATGADVTMAMGHAGFADLGMQTMSSIDWGVWVTWRDYGIHITVGNPPTPLSLLEVLPNGDHHYASDTLAIPFIAEVTNPDQTVDEYMLEVTDMAWTSPVPVPAATTAGALAGFGMLLGVRRRRA